MRKILAVILVLSIFLAGCGPEEEFNPYVAQVSDILDLNEDFDPLSLIRDVENAGLKITVAESTIDTSVPGDYTITYNVANANGKKSVTKTFNVSVKDYDAPVLTVGDTITLKEGATFKISDYASASDDREGVLTSAITYTGTINTYKVGTYSIIVSVADSYGNESTKTVKVVVKADSTESYKDNICGSYSDIDYTDGQAPTLTLSSGGTFTFYFNGCSILNGIEGTYVQHEDTLYLTSENFTFSTVAEENLIRFKINADGSLSFDSEMEVCAPNYGDIFTK